MPGPLDAGSEWRGTIYAAQTTDLGMNDPANDVTDNGNGLIIGAGYSDDRVTVNSGTKVIYASSRHRATPSPGPGPDPAPVTEPGAIALAVVGATTLLARRGRARCG